MPTADAAVKAVLTLAGLVVVTGVLFLSARINFTFWSSTGHTEADAFNLGWASVCADVFKALLPVFAGWAWTQGKWSYVIGATVLFVFCATAGMVAALGYLSNTHSASLNGIEAQNAVLSLTKQELSEVSGRLNKIGSLPLPRQIETDIAARKLDKRWTTSRECTDVTSAPSRDFCSDVFGLQGQLEASIEAQRLTVRLAELRQEAVRLEKSGAGAAADPLGELIGKLMPSLRLGPGTSIVYVMFSILIEVIGAFGYFFVLNHGGFTGFRKPLRAAVLESRAPSIAENRPGLKSVVENQKPTPLIENQPSRVSENRPVAPERKPKIGQSAPARQGSRNPAPKPASGPVPIGRISAADIDLITEALKN
jgi:hypothetical protein